jgi:hypothetical protein
MQLRSLRENAMSNDARAVCEAYQTTRHPLEARYLLIAGGGNES